jgi:hypothetical protein
VERFPGNERPVPKEWMKERVRWAKQSVFDVLGDPKTRNLLAADGKPNKSGFYPVENKCEAVYDLIEYTEHAAFWSEFVFTFNGFQ